MPGAPNLNEVLRTGDGADAAFPGFRTHPPRAPCPDRSFAQVNLTALQSNVAVARARAPGAQVFAVVKANAYGHGLQRVLPALDGADGLALLELDAAVQLRAVHYTRRILLLEGFFDPRELPELSARRLATVVH